MNYEESLDYLYSRLPMFQRVGKKALKHDLGNTIKLLGFLGNPHECFKSIHIAGTNGKGSSAHALAAILQQSGYSTGLYTSPHLKSFTERIKLNGNEVEEVFVVEFVEKINPAIEKIQPSFFEITVAMAFQYFRLNNVDIAVIETGLGGRLDSTNVITPEVSLITNIGYDHTDILGNTLPEIASEKAGIIKSGVPVVIGKYQAETFSVFIEKAREMNATLSLRTDDGDGAYLLKWPYYKRGCYNGVFGVVEELRRKGWIINRSDASYGFNHFEEITGFKGRFQEIGKKPRIIADVSHNPAGLSVLMQQLHHDDLRGKLHIIFGTVKDKDLSEVFNVLPKRADYYWTQSGVPRSLEVSELCSRGRELGFGGNCYADVSLALNEAKSQANDEDTILITGSTFVVAEIADL